MGISLWADRASAETYQTSTYPTIVEKLNPVLVGTPRVETYEVFERVSHAQGFLRPSPSHTR